jgi:hypothetical protein
MDTATQIVNELRGMKLSDTYIASRVKSSQPTIWRIRKGKAKSCSSELYVNLVAMRDLELAKRHLDKKAA